MERQPRPLTLVDPRERLALRLGPTTLYYRRLSLGALAAIERQQTVWLPGQEGQAPQAVLPAAAREAAVLAQVLVGWEGVAAPGTGMEAAFDPGLMGRLPAAVRRLVIRRAQKLYPPKEESL